MAPALRPGSLSDAHRRVPDLSWTGEPGRDAPPRARATPPARPQQANRPRRLPGRPRPGRRRQRQPPPGQAPAPDRRGWDRQDPPGVEPRLGARLSAGGVRDEVVEHRVGPVLHLQRAGAVPRGAARRPSGPDRRRRACRSPSPPSGSACLPELQRPGPGHRPGMPPGEGRAPAPARLGPPAGPSARSCSWTRSTSPRATCRTTSSTPWTRWTSRSPSWAMRGSGRRRVPARPGADQQLGEGAAGPVPPPLHLLPHPVPGGGRPQEGRQAPARRDGRAGRGLLDDALALFGRLREAPGCAKRPATAELLDWLVTLHAWPTATESTPFAGRPGRSPRR